MVVVRPCEMANIQHSGYGKQIMSTVRSKHRVVEFLEKCPKLC